MKQAEKHNRYDPISPELEKIGECVVDSAYRIHKSLGPGLSEKIYEVCFCHELSQKDIESKRQVALPIHYDGLTFEEGLRLDVLVADEVICELKAVDEINPVGKHRF